MHLGWRGFFGTVAITATLTSAFWLSLHPWERTTPTNSSVQSLASTGRGGGQPDGGINLSGRVTNDRLIVPVVGVRPQDLVDTFNDARSEGRVHDAIDIMAPLGTPVVAAAPGRVEKLFVSKAGGNTVYQRSRDGGTVYYYAHLDRYAPGLAEGMNLDQGSRIGAVGFTGNASPEGPHLHFAVLRTSPQRHWYEASTPDNPYPLLAGR